MLSTAGGPQAVLGRPLGMSARQSVTATLTSATPGTAAQQPYVKVTAVGEYVDHQ